MLARLRMSENVRTCMPLWISYPALCSFILKAVGPGLVVPAMFQLQKTGLGKDQGEDCSAQPYCAGMCVCACQC